MKLRSSNVRSSVRALFALSPLVAGLAMAADVVVAPTVGSSFVVKDTSAATDRFRVTEAGAVSMPSVPAAAAKSIALCADAVGVLGPCAANAGFSLPFAATINNAATLFDVTQSGTGGALKGAVTTAANTGAAVRGDTSGNVMKPATVETGATVQVPLFIRVGDMIKIDTRSHEYVERVAK